MAGLPLSIEPDGAAGAAALAERAAAERERWSAALLVHGALLFRGWGLAGLDDFSRFVAAFSDGAPLFGYAGGASPRQALSADGVYSSTEYPADMPLSLHNELSYAAVHPRRLFFFCLIAPEEGGETTLGDSRRILAALDSDMVDEFRRRGIRYVRNLSGDEGSGYSWQEALETGDAAHAAARCRAIGAEAEWRPGGMLRIAQTRPATAIHSETGEEVWFNQADGFHPSALAPDVHAQQLALCGSEEDFRLTVTFGDGGAIAPAALSHIREVLRAETVPHRWRHADVLVLDNILAAHGRAPFRGPRSIALAMT
ncbi:MAG TPA: TauD/TfdA family dioxygenase [Allosphingosinicella sp.]|jgi:hypothetical protein